MAHPDYSDLVKNIRDGDKQSLEVLFRGMYMRLRNYANVLINDLQESEDIIQEVFLKLWAGRHDLDEKRSVESYLFVAVRNSCYNWLKHKRIRNDHARIMALVYLEDPGNPTPHDQLLAADIEKDLYKVLDHLPDQCRKIFELSRFEGLKYHEIAARLNISIKTVETQMSRALVKLRSMLKEHTKLLLLACLLPDVLPGFPCF